MVGPPGLASSSETGGTFRFFTAKEGTMNAEIWIELAIVLLRILAAGLSG
jgi:hypothetical protein